jgi:hypothetical protein
VRAVTRIILCLSLALAFAGVAAPAGAGCYPPPCAPPAVHQGEPAAPVEAIGQASAHPVDSRSPALVVGFALLLVAGTLSILCASRYHERAVAAAELTRRPAPPPTARAYVEKSVV